MKHSTFRLGLAIAVVFGFTFYQAQAAVATVGPTNVLFYAPFDAGTLNALYAVGSTNPVSCTNVTLIDGGHRGQGTLACGATSLLKYSAVKNIDCKAGSISLWVKPLGWDLNDRNQRNFFFISDGADGYLTYTKPLSPLFSRQKSFATLRIKCFFLVIHPFPFL